MLVRTFTSTWNLRTKIYAFDDVKVPIKGGITIPQLLAGVGAALVWIPFCLLIQMPSWIPNTGFLVGIMGIPPLVVLLKADTPIAHEKTTEEWLTSWLTRRSEPQALAALASARPDHPVVLTGSRWVPTWLAAEERAAAVLQRKGAGT